MSDLALISPISAPRSCIAADDTSLSKHEGGSVSVLSQVLENGVNGMKTRVISVLALVVALANPVAAQDARPDISENQQLNDTLFAILVADEIRNRCDSISGRVLKGIGMLWNLVGDAKDEGYTEDEINAYRNSDEAKAALRARGEVLMAELNVSYDDPETFCRWGRDEIAAKSLTGSLLRAK